MKSPVRGLKLVDPAAIRFAFVGHGERADVVARKDRLWLDVGNDLRPGVVDQHHLAAYSGSTAGLVLTNRELVEAAVNPRRRASDPFTLVLHAEPDLDCVASAWLATRLVTTGCVPDGAQALVRYADLVDEGRLGASLERPFSLYCAYLLHAHRLLSRAWRSRDELWRRCVDGGLELLEHVVGEVVARSVSILEVDAFACPGLFGPKDREEVSRDIERYRRSLADPACAARIVELKLPSQLGGRVELDALLVREVQNADDPDPCMFFKDWARSDRERSPRGEGFAALCLYSSRSAAGQPRGVLSVTPQSGASLRGLGAALDEAEAARRIELHGIDDRLIDPATRAPKPPRAGYGNSDPWYDGRAHGYTIVDAPRSGTRLTADAVEALLVRFGGDAQPAPLRIPAAEAADAPASDETLRQLTVVAQAWHATQAKVAPGRPVFISYPRARLSWVQENLYRPLVEELGAERVFFDSDSLAGGAGWLATLGAAVADCRVFVAAYCPEYFRSDFCQWELQLALIRDPTGKKGIVVPVRLEPVELPPYCALIQAEDPSRPGFRAHLKHLVARALETS